MNDKHCSAYDEKLCLECEKDKNPNVRFVRACPNGHLDEVYWYSEVHHGNKSCSNKKHFYWKVNGSSLENIIIECPVCGNETNMQEIYKNRTLCTSRTPENEEFYGYKILSLHPQRKRQCSEEMSVIQKQSSSLRLPYTKTLLKIPTFDETILDLFNNSKFKAYMDGSKNFDVYSLPKDKFIDGALTHLDNEEYWLLSDYLEKNEISDLYERYNKVGQREPSFTNAVDEEFRAIRYGEKDSANFSRSDFIPYNLETLDYKFPLDICAIDKLTTVTAQISYQRKPHPPKKNMENELNDDYEFVNIGYEDNEVQPPKIWYPAYKGIGEGIFITSKENPFDFTDKINETVNNWNTHKVSTLSDRPETENPLFVWWHTLSHAIIKSLSLFCGYSSASLHERIYLDEDSEQGGILIYNTSPGDDSGMGGLVDLVFNELEFKKVLKNAINSLLVCSNDPLCSSVKLEEGRVNGSACHNCLLISETSCEHQNQLLDRNFFIT